MGNITNLYKRKLGQKRSRNYKLAIFFDFKNAKEICDQMNKSQMYKHEWGYFLADEHGVEIYPTSVEERRAMMYKIMAE